MTTAVMAPDDPHGHNAPLRPIVLALNCATASQYLSENEVLMCLGLQLIRIDIEADWRLSSTEIASAEMFELSKLYDWMTFKDLSQSVRDPRWLREQFIFRLEDRIKDHVFNKEYDPSKVKVVLLDERLTQGDGNVLQELLTNHYPGAALFRISKHSDRRPHRIWMKPSSHPEGDEVGYTTVDRERVPLCPSCGKAMRPAGSGFVCKGCGNTLGCR